MELRVTAALAKYRAGPLALVLARAAIREMRVPTEDMLKAMKAAMWRSGLQRGGHVTTTLKHQLRWAAGIDAASPPEGADT
jgi:hypothetical protein